MCSPAEPLAVYKSARKDVPAIYMNAMVMPNDKNTEENIETR